MHQVLIPLQNILPKTHLIQGEKNNLKLRTIINQNKSSKVKFSKK